MITIHPDYVVDNEKRTKAVILPFAEWEMIVEELEKLDELIEYDQAKDGPQDSISFDQAVREIQEGYGG